MIRIKSPYPDNTAMLGDKDWSDVQVVLSQTAPPLLMHRNVLGAASATLGAVLRGGESPWCVYDRASGTLTWLCDAMCDQQAVCGLLRFCYGQELCLDPGTCAATLAAACRLGLHRIDSVVAAVEQQVVALAAQNVELGTLLLLECANFEECCDEACGCLDRKIAALLFTPENIAEHYDQVVDSCLMLLPPKYLECAQFGEAPTQGSRECVIMRYITYNINQLDELDMRRLLEQCDLTAISSRRLLNLHRLLAPMSDVCVEMCCNAVKRLQQELEQTGVAEQRLNNEYEEAKQQIEQYKQRAEKAERENNELQKQLEQAQREAAQTRRESLQHFTTNKQTTFNRSATVFKITVNIAFLKHGELNKAIDHGSAGAKLVAAGRCILDSTKEQNVGKVGEDEAEGFFELLQGNLVVLRTLHVVCLFIARHGLQALSKKHDGKPSSIETERQRSRIYRKRTARKHNAYLFEHCRFVADEGRDSVFQRPTMDIPPF